MLGLFPQFIVIVHKVLQFYHCMYNVAVQFLFSNLAQKKKPFSSAQQWKKREVSRANGNMQRVLGEENDL